jgi:hypothetical protein
MLRHRILRLFEITDATENPGVGPFEVHFMIRSIETGLKNKLNKPA